MSEEMKQVFISYTEGDDDFRIVGKDYEEVLKYLCLFLNDQLNFPYTFSMGYKPKEKSNENEINI